MKESVQHRSRLDRRIVRTRKQLRDALVALVLERGWDAVTVQQVCERANVARSTMYLHFADKEDLLFSGFSQLQASLEHVRERAPGQFAFVRDLIAHTQAEQRLFDALARSHAGRHVITHLRALSLRLVSSELGCSTARPDKQPLVARYIAGGLIELIVSELEAARHQPADELAASFVALSPRLIEAASSRDRRG